MCVCVLAIVSGILCMLKWTALFLIKYDGHILGK